MRKTDGKKLQVQYLRSQIADTPWEKAGLNYSIFTLHTRWNQVFNNIETLYMD